jgi:hypothetical protein
MLQRLALALALIGLVNAPTAKALADQASTQSFVIAQAALPPVFDSASEAQAHCPKDVVVWLNIPSGIYHYKGERWYGRTKHGAFACEKEAIRVGDRASENGQ